MKKGLAILFKLTGISLLFSAFSFLTNASFETNAIEEEVDAQVASVQVRSNGGGENYLVIIDENINPNFPQENTKWTSHYTAKDKINIYLDETNFVPLNDIYDSTSLNSWWCFNKWGCPGSLMIPINDLSYATYNASSIFMIEILEECSYPTNTSRIAINKETCRFINLNYQSGNTLEAFDWAIDMDYEEGDELLELYGAQVRGDASGHYIDLRCHLYEEEPTQNFVNLGTKINAYDNIYVFKSETDEGKTLGEICSRRNGVINKWGGTFAFMFYLTNDEFDEYNGSTIHHIRVTSDCELIYKNKICKVSSAVTFNNEEDKYGNPAYKNETVDLLLPPLNPQPLDEAITINEAQVRSEDASEEYYIDFLADVYIGRPFVAFDDLRDINAYDFIKIYTSETEFETLGNITTKREGCQRKWDNNFLFALSKAEYETYNGTTIYKIEILKDCELYVHTGSEVYIAKVDTNYVFKNMNFGNPAKKYENFTFTLVVDELENFGSINVTMVHNRMDSPNRDRDDCNRWIMFLVDDRIYTVNKVVTGWIDQLNFLDNVHIYLTENSDPIALREIFDVSASGVRIKEFGEINMFSVSILNTKEGGDYLYDGPHMYSIVINAGTQIPTFENGKNGFRTIEDKISFINDEYGLFGPIDDMWDEDYNPRLYEEWNTMWSAVRCFVTFEVQGIDGVSFPEISLQKGERVSLETYKIDGYKLEVTTSDGDQIFESIIGTNNNLKIILKYSKAGEIKTPLYKNLAFILPVSIGGGLLVLSGALVITFIVKRKKKGISKNV